MSLINDFLHTEEKYQLNTYCIDGFYPWVYSRFTLYASKMFPISTPDRSKSAKLTSSLRLLLKLLRMAVRKINTPGNISILFVAHQRRMPVNGVYECIYTDALSELFPDSATFEGIYNFGHLTPAKTKNIIYADKLIFNSYIYGFINKLFRTKKYKEIYNSLFTQFQIPLKELSECSGLDLDAKKWATETTVRYFRYKARRKSIKKILEKTSPQLIVETVHYTTEAMIINELAKEMNIPTVELQHGAIDCQSIAYNYPPGANIQQFADKLFLFSDFWAKTASYPLPESSLISVGFPYFESQYELYKKDRRPDKKTLIFLTQPNIAPLYRFDYLALETSKRLIPLGWNIIFKLHPQEYDGWHKHYPLITNTEIQVVCDSIPLYELFASATALVGFYSTAIYEGIGFGVKAFIYDTDGSERMDDICNLGCASKFSDVDDLCCALENTGNADIADKSVFCKSNALKNIENEILRLLKQAE